MYRQHAGQYIILLLARFFVQRKQIFISHHKMSQFFIIMWGGVMCIFISLILIQFTNANDIITINNTDCKNGTHYFQCKDGK